MIEQLECQFSVSQWLEAEQWQQDGHSLKTAQVSYDYSGDLIGTSRAEYVLLYLPDGSASYTAVELFTGTYRDQACTLVLNHTGLHQGNAAVGRCQVMSASGALTGFDATGLYRADAATVALILVAN